MHSTRNRTLLGLLIALCAATPPGCDRGDVPAGNPDTSSHRELVEPPAVQPEFAFARGLRDDYPEVSDFVREFLLTCLAGDYTGYRQLVSRTRTPESKERFQAIFHAIRSVTVETIEPLDIPALPQPTFLVISTVDFLPEHKVKLRKKHEKIAILVFPEDDQWRMAPAPADFQPDDQPPATTTTAPTSTARHYPWDANGDY
ncbi:MAG: hypothetical protein KKB50_10985 [Planctomycetes bacterium]|nr:hypothetical protein [Planctomycetota bacterium]